MNNRALSMIAFISLVITLLGCTADAALVPTPTPPVLANELIFYDWEEDMPQSVLDAFTQEYGVKVTYLAYENQKEALANIRAGQVYDVVVFDNDNIPTLLAEGLLAEIDYRHVPNFKHISPNFRDLAYDPENKHSVPWNWGTTGLVVRSDLLEQPVNSWASLWDPRYAGKIAIRNEPREIIAVALKSLGYSVNTTNVDELRAAQAQLLKLSKPVTIIGADAEDAVAPLLSGQTTILVGWVEDVLTAREENDTITYVLPQDGAMVWGDNFVIPANSPRKYTAEVFINFLMRPEINAQIVNENSYATANEGARPFIDPEISNDPAVFPDNKTLANAEVYLPLGPETEILYAKIWQEFLATVQ